MLCISALRGRQAVLPVAVSLAAAFSSSAAAQTQLVNFDDGPQQGITGDRYRAAGLLMAAPSLGLDCGSDLPAAYQPASLPNVLAPFATAACDNYSGFDGANGPTFTFVVPGSTLPTTVDQFSLISNDGEGESGGLVEIRAFDAAGVLIASASLAGLGDSGRHPLAVAAPGIASVRFFGSPETEAIDDVRYRFDACPPDSAALPAEVAVCPGASAVFALALAGGAPPLGLRWRHGGVDIPGETGPSLTVHGVSEADEGRYDCVVASACGERASAAANLVVCSGCVGDLTCDCRVDLTDVAALLSNFGGAGGAAQGDLDGDGRIDLTDLAIQLAAFGAFCR